MKALKTFTIALILALFLVPINKVYALTNADIENVKASAITWFKVQSKTNVNQYYYVFCNTDTPIEYKSFGTWKGVALKNPLSTTLVHTNYYTSDGGTTWEQQASKNMSIGGYGTPYDTDTDFTVISASKKIANTVSGGDYYNPQVIAQDVKILLPTGGSHKDTTTALNVWVWYKLPQGTETSKVDISVTCPTLPVVNQEVTNNEYSPTTGEGNLNFGILDIPVGLHYIEVKVNGVSKSIMYERFGGIVDENGDELDDRTGLPVGDGHINYPDTGSTFDGMIDALKNSPKYFEGIIKLFTEMTSWLPTEVKVVLILATTVIFAIILKRVVL